MANAQIIFYKTIKFIEKYAKSNDLSDAQNKKDLETKVLQIIDKYPNVLRKEDKYGRNIGMIACQYGMGNIAMKMLHNSTSIFHLDKLGQNIGIYAAENKLQKVVLKAMDYPKLCIQKDHYGRTLAFAALEFDLNRAIIKALRDPVMSQQKTKIGMDLFTFTDCVKNQKPELYQNLLNNLSNDIKDGEDDESIDSSKICITNYKKSKEEKKIDKTISKIYENIFGK